MTTHSRRCSNISCQRPNQVYVKTFPGYLILVKGNEPLKPQIELMEEESQQKRVYNVISVCLYTGNSRSGHYVAYRKLENGKDVKISDGYVYDVHNVPELFTETGYEPMFGIYAKG